MSACRPFVSILRGLMPDDTVPVGQALVAAGIEKLVVPLNRPQALDCIAALARALGGAAEVGAGTIVVPDQVDPVIAHNGRLIVRPNFDPYVVSQARRHG